MIDSDNFIMLGALNVDEMEQKTHCGCASCIWRK